MRKKFLVLVIVVGILEFFLFQHCIIDKVNWKNSFKSRSYFKSNSTMLNIMSLDFIYTSLEMTELCKNTLTLDPGSKLLVVIIPSARENFKLRELIRKTWGSLKKYKNWSVIILFTLGIAIDNENSAPVQALILNESHKYSDIIMGNFIDSYKNLSYKHLIGYKWILKHCENADFVLKADDDVFVNIFQVINFIEQVSKISITPYVTDYSYYCHVNDYFLPIRTKTNAKDSKWQVTREEWPFDYYPIYCGFASYLTKVEVINKIFNVSLRSDVNYFWVEHVFVTGILREKFNELDKQTNNPISLKHIGDGAYSWSWKALKLKDYNCTGTNWDKKLFVVVTEHDSLDLMRLFWDCILNGTNKRTNNYIINYLH